MNPSFVRCGLTYNHVMLTLVLIERECHIPAGMSHVRNYCKKFPFLGRQNFVPEGAGTRIRLQAEVDPDELAEYIDGLLLVLLQEVRTNFERPRSQKT